jgi:hypothetical protein
MQAFHESYSENGPKAQCRKRPPNASLFGFLTRHSTILQSKGLTDGALNYNNNMFNEKHDTIWHLGLLYKLK